jgi:hypothetical protein
VEIGEVWVRSVRVPFLMGGSFAKDMLLEIEDRPSPRPLPNLSPFILPMWMSDINGTAGPS